jgi:methanogenic corrinoid protein MtbC1
MGWLRNFFDGIKVPGSDIIFFFEILEEKLSEYLTSAEYEQAAVYLKRGLERFNDPKPQAGFIDNNNPLSSLANDYLAHLLNAERREALNIIMDAYNNGVSIKDLYLNVFQPTQLEVGRLWQTNKISVAQEHYETAATQLIMSQLYPYLFQAVKKEKKIVVSCVSGELHEMGARMVADFFEMDGWDSYYLGANTPSESIIKTLEENNSKILALSVTMTYNLESAHKLIELIKNNPGTKNIKVLVGGYPFLISDSLWQKIGADGFSRNSDDAIRKADEILSATT